MMLWTIIVLLAGCAEATPRPNPPAGGGYSGLHRPPEFGTGKKDEPFVPPPAPEPEQPKADPCARPCAVFATADREASRLAEKCDKHQRELGHMNTDACQQKAAADQRYIAAKNKLGACSCD